jgi:hypothetical protein
MKRATDFKCQIDFRALWMTAARESLEILRNKYTKYIRRMFFYNDRIKMKRKQFYI